MLSIIPKAQNILHHACYAQCTLILKHFTKMCCNAKLHFEHAGGNSAVFTKAFLIKASSDSLKKMCFVMQTFLTGGVRVP